MLPELLHHSQAEDVRDLCVHGEAGGQNISVLLVYLGPILNFSYNHPHDVTPVGCGEGKELLVGGDITIP